MPALPWTTELLARTRSLFLLKLLGTSAFITLFFIAYLHLLKNPLHPVLTMPLTAVDHAIGFQPFALSIYVTLWIYVGIPPAFFRRRADLVGYGLAAAGICATGLLIFLFWPTAVPVQPLDWQDYPGSGLLKGVDAAGNACPSLHVATALFSGLWLHRLLKEIGAPRAVILMNILWCAAIAYSTLATKQHVFLDVAAGALLGWAGAWLSIVRYDGRCRQPAPEPPRMEPASPGFPTRAP